MRIMRADLVNGGPAELVGRYSEITTSVGSAFCANAAAQEAEVIGGRIESDKDILSGRAETVVYDKDNKPVARFFMEWPVEDDEPDES